MESHLVHGEGDKEGEPFRLPHHAARRLVYRWFEYSELSGLYLHQKGVVGWPKGSIKTEVEAALGLEHLEGPSWTYGTPVVTVAAVDGDQADELVRIAGLMIPEGSELEQRLEVTGGRIVHRRSCGNGRMLATSAALGKNDGKRTSLLLADEVHEWDRHSDAGAERHGILERSTNKRGNGRQLNVSTAGASLDSLLGAMYSFGCLVASGEVADPGFLFEWWEASDHWDLEDLDQLVAAICEANPMAEVVEGWVDRLVRSYRDHKLRDKVDEFCRYHLNRWMPYHEGAWMDMGEWDGRSLATLGSDGTSQAAPMPPEGTRVVLGFDGSESGDSTALVGVTVELEPYWFVIDCWEHDGTADWRVPVDEVEDAIVVACTRRGWDVLEVAADVSYWRGSLDRLAQRGLPIVEFPNGGSRLGPACEKAYELATRGGMRHDGDRRLRRHIENCRKRETEWGTRVVKETKDSPRRIDLAVAGIQANDRALFHLTTDPPPPPATPSIFVFPEEG